MSTRTIEEVTARTRRIGKAATVFGIVMLVLTLTFSAASLWDRGPVDGSIPLCFLWIAIIAFGRLAAWIGELGEAISESKSSAPV